jgi:hypothetical protein
MSFEIKFTDLWTYRVGRKVKKSFGRERLAMLDDKEYSHIHGELQIIIYGKPIPALGFDKNREVCIGYWLDGLTDVIRAFKSKEKEHIIYGWEQGIPSFKFEKLGKKGHLSIIDNPAMDAKGKDDWQKVEFDCEDFYNAYYNFKDALLTQIHSQAPGILENWKSRFDRGDMQ